MFLFKSFKPFCIKSIQICQSSVPITSVTSNEIFPVIDSISDVKQENYNVIVDARSPNEFHEDHLPGAVNVPVLSNSERQEVGKLYGKKMLSGRLLGAHYVLANLSQYLRPGGLLENMATQSHWRPLIYCWRGGQRSQAMATVLSELLGPEKEVCVLEGGYRAFRKQLVSELDSLPQYLDLRILSGLTGSGKTALLEALEHQGHHVLHLERIAKHRGSLLGSYAEKQPSQKAFDRLLWQELRALVAPSLRGGQRPIVWVECESRVVGSRNLPSGLWSVMREAKRVWLNVDQEERVKHILSEYVHFIQPNSAVELKTILSWLQAHHPEDRIAHWNTLVDNGNYTDLVRSLLCYHYDPTYSKSRQIFQDCTDPFKLLKFPLASLQPYYLKTEAVPALLRLVHNHWDCIDSEQRDQIDIS